MEVTRYPRADPGMSTHSVLTHTNTAPPMIYSWILRVTTTEEHPLCLTLRICNPQLRKCANYASEVLA